MAKTFKEIDPIPSGADINNYYILVDDDTNPDASSSSGKAPATFFKGADGTVSFDELTTEQKDELKGPIGPPGPPGPIGPPGAGAITPFLLSVRIFSGQPVPPAAFTKISFYSSDPSWDDFNKKFIAPVTGVYLFVLKVRIEDGNSTSSFGWGVHDSVADNPHFAWRSPVNGGRNSFLACRVMSLVEGDGVYSFVFSDDEVDLITSGTSMDVVRIS